MKLAAYANIADASPITKGMDAPAQVNENRMIDVNTAAAEEIEALPAFIKSKIFLATSGRAA